MSLSRDRASNLIMGRRRSSRDLISAAAVGTDKETLQELRHKKLYVSSGDAQGHCSDYGDLFENLQGGSSKIGSDNTSEEEMSDVQVEDSLAAGRDKHQGLFLDEVPRDEMHIVWKEDVAMHIEYVTHGAAVTCRSFPDLTDVDSGSDGNRHRDHSSSCGCSSLEVATTGFRISSSGGTKHAEFKIKATYNRERSTTCWRRHTDFENLIKAIKEGKLGDVPFTSTLQAWEDIINEKPLLRNLRPDYLRAKQDRIDVLVRSLLYEVPTLDAFMFFMEDEPSPRRSFTMSSSDIVHPSDKFAWDTCAEYLSTLFCLPFFGDASDEGI